MRRRIDPRKRDEAGGESARFHGADAVAGDHNQYQPHRLCAAQAGADGTFRRRTLAVIRPAADRRDRLTGASPHQLPRRAAAHPVFPDRVKSRHWWAWLGTAVLLIGEYGK